MNFIGEIGKTILIWDRFKFGFQKNFAMSLNDGHVRRIYAQLV